MPEFWIEAIYVPESDSYKIGWGVYCEIGKAMVEKAMAYTREYSKFLEIKIKNPALVVLTKPGKENMDETALYDDLTCEKALAELNASHCFYEENAAEELARVMEAFFSNL